jgi:hypothetical protein
LLTQPNQNQYAHPDAPKPIHPDKEHFCPSTLKLGAYIRFSVSRADLRRNSTKQKIETRFPHKRSYLAGTRRTANTIWWRWTESNRRPPACKAGALPIELHPLIYAARFSFRGSRRSSIGTRSMGKEQVKESTTFCEQKVAKKLCLLWAMGVVVDTANDPA